MEIKKVTSLEIEPPAPQLSTPKTEVLLATQQASLHSWGLWKTVKTVKREKLHNTRNKPRVVRNNLARSRMRFRSHAAKLVRNLRFSIDEVSYWNSGLFTSGFEGFWRWCITHRIAVFLDISPIWIPLFSNEVSNSQRRSVWHDRISICVHTFSVLSVSRFYSTDGTSGRYYMSSQNVFHFFAMVLLHLVLLVMFVAQIYTSFSIPVPRMCVLYHNFYWVFSCYLPPNKPGLEWLNSCVNLTEFVQWLRLALSKGPKRVDVFSPFHLRTETDPVSETSCFLVSRIPDDGEVKKPSNSVLQVCFIMFHVAQFI
jgi:hypothetical protein